MSRRPTPADTWNDQIIDVDMVSVTFNNAPVILPDLKWTGYAELSPEVRVIVQQRTGEIKRLMRKTAQGVIDIGSSLIDVKTCLDHGQFGGWLDSEFAWSERTARNFMAVAEQFKSANFADLLIAPSALYLLASPSTPEPARVEIIERARSGEHVTYTEAKETIQQYRTADEEVLAKPMHYELYDEGGEQQHMVVGPHEEIAVVKMAHVGQNSGNNEWYTPAEYIEAARKVMGHIDLDPASTGVANTVVQARNFFTAEENGLLYDWHGKVWMNPPYAQPAICDFTNRLTEEYRAKRVTEAIVLVNNATETLWFQDLVACASAVCFPSGRVKFWAPDRVAAPLQGQAVIYLGDDPARFIYEFIIFGWCAEVTKC